MTPLGKRLAALFYALGLVSAALAYVLFCAWLAPTPPPYVEAHPVIYRVDQLAPEPSAPRESWEHYQERMDEQEKGVVR